MQAANPPERKAQIQSVERAIWILQCFYDHKELHVIEISELLGLNKSTTMGLVRTLQAYQFLTRNPETGKYRLGSELFRLGSKVDADLQNLVTPYINELADQFHETVNLMVLDGTSLLRVVKRESVHSLRNTSQTGRREPLHLSAGGKAMLAAMSPDRARSILDNSVFVRYTDTTLVTVNQVLNDLEKTRQRGYAVDDGEVEYGLLCVGEAILDSKQEPVAALTVSGPSFRISGKKMEQIVAELNRCCREIESKLAGNPFV